MTESVPTITWIGGLGDGHCEIIDQTLLPGRLEVLHIDDCELLREAIRRLAVRGAPAIGVAAAFGLVLALRQSKAVDPREFLAELARAKASLSSARPTAVNLVWALNRLGALAEAQSHRGVDVMKQALFEESMELLEEDRRICHRLGEIGSDLVKDGDRLLTHCNAGALATGGYGTALAVMFEAQARGKSFEVYAGETRPLLQGARLTTWELMRAGIDVTLICDSMVAQVMKEGRIQRVFVGADRIARNGDTANKIGTYSIAVLAREHEIPFYVVAPTSTFDLSLESGAQIPIEERAAEEITESFGQRLAPAGVKVYAPAFDVTPARLITGIVTERGLITPVSESGVLAVVG